MPPLNGAQRDAVRRFVEATGASEKTAQKVGLDHFPWEVLKRLSEASLRTQSVVPRCNRSSLVLLVLW